MPILRRAHKDFAVKCLQGSRAGSEPSRSNAEAAKVAKEEQYFFAAFAAFAFPGSVAESDTLL